MARGCGGGQGGQRRDPLRRGDRQVLAVQPIGPFAQAGGLSPMRSAERNLVARPNLDTAD